MIKPELQREEWDFDPVPEVELFPCCFWEYARESESIREFYSPKPFPEGQTKPDRFHLCKYARLTKDIYDYALPIHLTVSYCGIRDSDPLDLPWVKIISAARQKVVEALKPHLSKEVFPSFLPFNRCSDMHDIGLADEDYRCAELDYKWGIERLRVEIDWGGFSDAQIVTAFKKWIAENRPPGFGSADQRGKAKAKGLRNNLAWLGIMRLMNESPFTSIKSLHSEAFQFYSTADWPRSRKKAIQQFKEMYHFLPENELPIHAATAGGRAE